MGKLRNLLAAITLFVLMCSCGIPEPLKYAEVEPHIKRAQQIVETGKEFYYSNKEDIKWLWDFFQQHPDAAILTIKNGEEAGFSLYCDGGIHDKGPMLDKPELLSVCEFYPSEVKEVAYRVFSINDGVPNFTVLSAKHITVYDRTLEEEPVKTIAPYVCLIKDAALIPPSDENAYANRVPRGAIEIYDIEDDWKVMIAGSFLSYSIQDVRYYDTDGNVKA